METRAVLAEGLGTAGPDLASHLRASWEPGDSPSEANGYLTDAVWTKPACSRRRINIDMKERWSRQVSKSSRTSNSWPRGFLIAHTLPAKTNLKPFCSSTSL